MNAFVITTALAPHHQFFQSSLLVTSTLATKFILMSTLSLSWIFRSDKSHMSQLRSSESPLDNPNSILGRSVADLPASVIMARKTSSSGLSRNHDRSSIALKKSLLLRIFLIPIVQSYSGSEPSLRSIKIVRLICWTSWL
jgi:hypothetical protein